MHPGRKGSTQVLVHGKMRRRHTYGFSNAFSLKNDVHSLKFHPPTVQLCCGTRGDIEHPRNLDEAIAFARDIIVDKPIPEWLFQILDELHEVEASATVSNVQLRKISFFLKILIRPIHEKNKFIPNQPSYRTFVIIRLAIFPITGLLLVTAS